MFAAHAKLACFFPVPLTREEVHPYQRPSLTKTKLRRPEVTAGAPKHQGCSGIRATNQAMRETAPSRDELRALRERDTA